MFKYKHINDLNTIQILNFVNLFIDININKLMKLNKIETQKKLKKINFRIPLIYSLLLTKKKNSRKISSYVNFGHLNQSEKIVKMTEFPFNVSPKTTSL